MSEQNPNLPPDFIGFPDLAGLKTAHARLIQQQGEAAPADFLDTVEAFIIRAQATGQLLGNDDERTGAQNIIDYWVTVLLRGRRTPPETGLAEFGFRAPTESIRDRPVAEYLTEERTAIRRRLGLSVAAVQWNEGKRHRALLWGGEQLDDADEYTDLTPLEREFIAASRREERTAALRRRIVLYAALLAAAIIVALTIWSLVLKTQAAQEQTDRETRNKRDVQHQLATKLVERAAVLMRERDVTGSLLWLAEALHEEIAAGDVKAQAVHRIRIGAALAQLPRLPQVFLEDKPDFLCTTARFSPDGSQILTVASQRGGEAGIARLWDAKTGEELAYFEEPEAGINDAGFCADGRILTAAGKRGSGKGTVRLWDRNAKPSGEIEHAGGAVLSAVISRDGARVALLCEGMDGNSDTVEVRQLSDGGPLTGPLGWKGEIRGVSFSPNGDYVMACGAMNDQSSGTAPRIVGQVQVWNSWNGELLSLGDMRHELPVNCASFAADNARLITGTGDLDVRHGTVELRNPFTGERTFAAQHDGQVVMVCFSPDDQRVVSASQDETARVWSAVTGAALREFRHESPVYSAAFSPDGRYVVSGGRDHTARVWKMATGGLALPPLTHGVTVSRVEFSADGLRILATTPDGARLWQMQTGEPLSPVLQLNEPIWKMAISGEGARVVAVSHDGNLGVWDTRKKEGNVSNLQPLSDADAVFFSADTRRAVISKGKVSRLYSTEGDFAAGPSLENAAPLIFAAFSPDGTRVLTSCGTRGSSAGTTRIWDTASGTPVGIPLAATGAVTYAVFSGDGKSVLTASGKTSPAGGEARVWEVASGEPLTPPLSQAAPVTHASFNHDLTRIVTASADDSAEIWNIDLTKHTALEWRPLIEHTADLTHASFSPDGRTVVTASYDRSAVLWDVETGRRRAVLPHPGWINDAQFTSDSRFLVTACADQTARVWNVATGDWVSLFRHDGEVTRAFFAKNRQSVVTLSAYEPAAVLRTTQGSLLSALAEPGADSARERTMLKVQTWRLPREASSEQDIHSFAQVMRGRSIEGNRDFVRLGREVFREHWLELLPGFVGDFNANISAIPRLHAVQESQATGEWFAARWHLDRLLAVEPENTDLLVQRGLASVNLLDWAAAIRDFEKAAAPKKTVSLLTRLARANLELAHFDQTIRHTTEGLGLKPDDRNLYMLRAEAYAATQAWDKAATDLLEAIKLRPRMTSGYQRLSIVRLQQGQPEEYRAQCARLLELLKDDDNIGGFVAWACVLLDRAVPDPEVPVRLVTRILADNPDSYRLLNNAGAALYRAGHFQKAFQKLDESRATYTRAAGLAQLRGDPNAVLMPVQDGRPVDWLFLAMTHAKLGNPREAEEWLKKADDAITRKSVAELGGTWRRLELKILLDEATALIRGLGPKP